MTGENLHSVITEHRDWAAFDEEQAKAQRLLERSQSHSRKAVEARREWEAATAAYDAEVTDAALNGREPDPTIEDPGEWIEPRPLLGRRRPVEVVHERIGQVDAMRRAWAARMAPELSGALVAEDTAAVQRVESSLAALADAVREVERVRGSLTWLRACGGKAEAPQGLWAVQSLLGPLQDAVRRVQRADQVSAVGQHGGIPFNLDDVDISVG